MFEGVLLTTGDNSQTERGLPGKDEAAAWLASPSELEIAMNQTFRYVLRRGLLIVLAVHPYYKAFQQLHRAEAGEPVSVKIPFRFLAPFKSLTLFLFWLPFEFKLEVKDDKATIIYDPRRWLRNVLKWTLPESSIISFNSFLREHARNITLSNNRSPLSMVLLEPALAVPAILLYLPWYVAWTLIRSLSTTVWAALRLVPALLAILVVVFITGDAWKMFGLETNWRFFTLIILIAGITTAATLVALKGPEGDWRASTGYSTGGTKLLVSWASETPAKPLLTENVNPFFPIPLSKDSEDHYPYLKMHEKNISVLYVFTIVGNVVAAAFWIALTFIVVGIIAVNESLTLKLSDTPGIIIMHFNLVGQSFIVTRQLILVSVILGGVAALTFASGTLQDADKRHIFTDSALADLEQALGALAYYYGTVIVLLLKLRDTGTLAKLGQTNSEQLSNMLDRLISSPYFDRGSVPKG